jgi:hypothetical protein
VHGSLGSLMFVAAVAIAGVGRADGMPDWAFSANPPAPKPASPPMDDGIVIHVAGSAVGMTQLQVRDAFNVPDWHPDNRTPPPEAALRGFRLMAKLRT